MDRRYYRQHENFDTVIPRIEDFPVLDSKNNHGVCHETQARDMTKSSTSIRLDDVVLVGILILLLMEDDKDITAILGIAFLFLAEYIF